MPRSRLYGIFAGTVEYHVSVACLLLLGAAAAAQEQSRAGLRHDFQAPVRNIGELRQQLQAIDATLSQLRAGSDPVSEATQSGELPPRHQGYLQPAFSTAAEPSHSNQTQHFSLAVGGYVKADFLHDFNAIGSTDVFDPLTIPTGGRPGHNTRFHARQTRLNIEYLPHVDCDDVKLFIESDFFGREDALRLRHAFFRGGRLLVGQTWSTFMDESILPATLDFESPRSVVLDRRALIRWTERVTESLAVASALEDPQTAFDLSVAGPGDVERPGPDLISRVRYERSWGHLQSAAVVRWLRFRQTSHAKDDAAGWGCNFTGRVHCREVDSLLFQVAFGEGIESYRQAFDGAVDASGRIEVNQVFAWVVGYEIGWSDRLRSTLVYSASEATNAAFQLATSASAAEYFAANIRFEPLPRLSYGVEYLYGTRTDTSGSRGEANRLQLSVKYELP